MKRYIGWKIAGGIVLAAVFFIAIGYGTMYLWNWLIPSLFNGPVISFWEAWGLFLLCKILFGFPKGGHHEGGWASKKRKWKERMKAKMEHMTPEEKERVKNSFERCMGGGRWGWNAPKEDLPNETKEQL